MGAKLIKILRYAVPPSADFVDQEWTLVVRVPNEGQLQELRALRAGETPFSAMEAAMAQLLLEPEGLSGEDGSATTWVQIKRDDPQQYENLIVSAYLQLMKRGISELTELKRKNS